MKRTYTHPAGLPAVLPITAAEVNALGLAPDELGNYPFEKVLIPPHNAIRKLRGLAARTTYSHEGLPVSREFLGVRRMSYPRRISADCHRGQVNVDAGKHLANTGTQAFRIIETGEEITVATFFIVNP